MRCILAPLTLCTIVVMVWKQDCEVQATVDGNTFVTADTIHPEDVNEPQTCVLVCALCVSCVWAFVEATVWLLLSRCWLRIVLSRFVVGPFEATSLRLMFNRSSDLYGRVIIYRLDVLGFESPAVAGAE